MPVIYVTTNVPEAMVPEKFPAEFAEVLAQTLSKPITSISVIVHAGVRMFRFGSNEPAAIIDVHDIRKFDDKTKNREICNAATGFVANKLDLNQQRISAVLNPGDPTKIGLGVGILLSERIKK